MKNPYWVDDFLKCNGICPTCKCGLKIESAEALYDPPTRTLKAICVSSLCRKSWEIILYFKEI